MSVIKGYVVMETEWNYNDEYHYTGEDEGGSPVSVYTSRSKAEGVANAKSVERARTLYNGPFDYGDCYDEGRIDNIPEQVRKRLGIPDDEPWGWKFPASASDSDILDTLEGLGVAFFTVEEVPLELDVLTAVANEVSEA